MKLVTNVDSRLDSLGIKVVELCRTWRSADKEVKERIVIVESVWDRTRHQAEFVKSIASAMNDESRRIMGDVLDQLSLYLAQATNTLNAVIKTDSRGQPHLFGFGSRAKKASWVWKKDAVDGIIRNLEEWQRRFEPTWFLQVHNPNPLIDSTLAKAQVSEANSVGLPNVAKNPLAVAAGLRDVLAPKPEDTKSVFLPDSPMEWRNIPFSSMKTGRLLRASETRWYVVDTIEVGAAARVRDIARDVGVLATKLSRTDPLVFGLLNCKGVMAVPRQPTAPSTLPNQVQALSLSPLAPDSSLRSPSPSQRDYSCFKLVFRIPQGMETQQVQSLRYLLLGSDANISLSCKVCLARELAKAVNYVHTFAFVHKNIRPESILCFSDPQAARSTLFLAGFDAFRAADANTLMAGDTGWERNVYRHPLRQGYDPAEKYRMQHDIYSLGAVLLEIGLWESFVEYTTTTEDNAAGHGPPQPKPGRTYSHFQDWLRASRASMQQDGGSDDFLAASAFRLKDFLVEQARTRLAPRMGDKYARVAMSCLTCLDEDNEDFGGAEAADASDGAAALCFIGRILKDLDDISV